jgi:hypothetical protein
MVAYLLVFITTKLSSGSSTLVIFLQKLYPKKGNS